MILRDRDNSSVVLVGTAYGVNYYGTEDGRKTSFCRFRCNYGFVPGEFDKNQQLYFTCVAFGEKADYIAAVTDNAKPTLLVCGRLEEQEYKGRIKEQVVVEYVSVQPTLPTAVKKKREMEKFSDIDF